MEQHRKDQEEKAREVERQADEQRFAGLTDEEIRELRQEDEWRKEFEESERQKSVYEEELARREASDLHQRSNQLEIDPREDREARRKAKDERRKEKDRQRKEKEAAQKREEESTKRELEKSRKKREKERKENEQLLANAYEEPNDYYEDLI